MQNIRHSDAEDTSDMKNPRYYSSKISGVHRTSYPMDIEGSSPGSKVAGA
jgi:hypothetical protein